jgi:septum formation topological specificity factor MinE
MSELDDFFDEYEERKAYEREKARLGQEKTKKHREHFVEVLRKEVLPVARQYASKIEERGHDAEVLDETGHGKPRVELRFAPNESEENRRAYSKLKFRARNRGGWSDDAYLEVKAMMETPSERASHRLSVAEEERLRRLDLAREWSEKATTSFVRESLRNFWPERFRLHPGNCKPREHFVPETRVFETSRPRRKSARRGGFFCFKSCPESGCPIT